MMSTEDDASKCLEAQVEEIEVLCSIYGSDWKSDESDGSYHIVIKEGDIEATLYITLPENYPFQAPPVYTLSAPCLSTDQKRYLLYLMDNVYAENIGETVLYQWIEKIREFLSSSATKDIDFSNIEERESIEAEAEKTEILKVPEIIHGDTISDRKSTFQGHTANVHSVDEVKHVMSALKENKKIANATHNVLAYRIARPDTGTFLQDCEDDGETQAGSRMLHLLQILNVENVMVVVSRWYGGILLGADRFRHINNATRQVLLQAGFIEDSKKRKS